MFNQKYIAVFIDRNRFMFYGGALNGVVSVMMPENVMQDLDISSKDTCYSVIKQWVKEYTLTGSQLIIILSDLSYFEKVFSVKEQSQVESDVLKFFDMVPYDSVLTRVYSTDKGKRAVAINKSLYDAIHQGFSLQGVHIKALIPFFAIGELSNRRIFDAQTGDYVITHIDTLQKQSLLDSQELSILSPEQHATESQDTLESPKKKSQLPMLLGVFGVLIIILAVVAYLQFG